MAKLKNCIIRCGDRNFYFISGMSEYVIFFFNLQFSSSLFFAKIRARKQPWNSGDEFKKREDAKATKLEVSCIRTIKSLKMVRRIEVA